jgi:hypothetical protein
MRVVFALFASFQFVALSVAAPLPPAAPWMQSASTKAPELAELYYGWFKIAPSWGDFNERSYMELERATEQALADRRNSLGEPKAVMIAEKLTAARAAQPPNWEVVCLALKAAFYAPPSQDALQIAEEIVKSPPSCDFGETLVADAMRLLAASKRHRCVEFVFDCANDDRYLKGQPYKPEVIASGAIHALATLPAVEARPYLERLARKYVLDPKTTEPAGGDATQHAIAGTLARAIQYTDMVLQGSEINVGSTHM